MARLRRHEPEEEIALDAVQRGNDELQAQLAAALESTGQVPPEFADPQIRARVGPVAELSRSSEPEIVANVGPVAELSRKRGAPAMAAKPGPLATPALGDEWSAWPGATPEQAEAVRKFATEQAKPMAPVASEEGKMQSALELAQEEAGRNRGWARIQSAGRNLGRAIGGLKPDEAFGAQLMKEAERPVLDEKARIQAALEEAERIARGEDRQLRREASTRADADRAESLRMQKLQLEATLKDKETDNTLAQSDLEERVRHNKAMEARQRRGGGAGGAGKGSADDPYLRIPGWNRGADAPAIKPEVAQKFRLSIAARDKLVGLIGKMRKLKEEHGSEVGPDLYGEPIGAEMDQVSTQMLTAIKEAESMGTIDKGVLEIAARLIPTSTTFRDKAKSQLKQMEDTLRSDVANQGRLMGYSEDGGGAAPAQAAGGRKVTMPDGSVWEEMPDGTARKVK